jgi:O-acetyl-ADP-ribose deacetylase
MGAIGVLQGDITRLAVDAIVNAANTSLLGGGGVDGAIHRAAGPGLVAECRTLHGCNYGEAKITKAYRLPCKWVIHTVGPIWDGGNDDEDDTLAACYQNSILLARKHDIKSIAFPAISTGIYGFPPARAAKIAVASILDTFAAVPTDIDVTLVAFDGQTADLYAAELGL